MTGTAPEGVAWFMRRHSQPRAVAASRPPETQPQDLTQRGQAYVTVIVAAGAIAILGSLGQLASGAVPTQWLILAALALLTAPLSIRIASLDAKFSPSETFLFASALLFGSSAAILTAAVDGVLCAWRAKTRKLHRTLFNIAEPALSIWISSECFYALTGLEPLFGRDVAVSQLLWPLVVLTTTFFVSNTGLIAFAVASETQISPRRFLRSNAPHLALNYFVSFSLVVLVAQQAESPQFAVVGVLIPLLVTSYFSSRASIGRMEDANRHLADLNKLHLSTIEVLAMAIDAKDQVTYGHIRRVQAHTVLLARALGVKDEMEIRALEAAGLLHDLGKLAVPDYILNKPGKLKPAEFELIKKHTSVGGKLLSMIEFPYPVAPIVRHHHEQWDGGGYPDGLRGAGIPLGARILAVVDCFDALTSDRPYRRKLSDEAALDYLQSERGKRYDPRIVDRFVELCPTLPRTGFEGGVLQEIAEMLSPIPAVPAAPVAAPNDAQRATELEGEIRRLRDRLEDETSFEEIGHAVAQFLAAESDKSVCTLYRCDSSKAELEAAYVSRDEYAFIRAVRMPLGDRLSGWVGASRQTIVNSDPALDLGELVRLREPRLRTCLSTALVSGDTLVGVLTLYSPDRAGFGDEHTRRVEHLAPVIAEFVHRRASLSLGGCLDAPSDLRVDAEPGTQLVSRSLVSST